MKTKTLLTTIIVFAIAFFSVITQGCKNYPDDDGGITFKSKADRVANSWTVDNYKINETDFTSLVNDYEEKFTKDGDYEYSWGILDGNGTWAFQDDKEEIKLTGNDDQSSRTLVILKLEEKEFWYYYMVGDDKHEFHLISE